MTILINGNFSGGWVNIVPPGLNLKNQQPSSWSLSWVEPGAPLYDSDDAATGVPECRHVLASQLPPHEQAGQPGALILAGDAVFKVGHFGAAFGGSLRQRVNGLPPLTRLRLTAHVLAVLYGDTDPAAVESGGWLVTDRSAGAWANAGQIGDRRWHKHIVETVVPANGVVDVVIMVKSKWPSRKDFFIDDIRLEILGQPAPPPPAPPPAPLPAPDVVEELLAAASLIEAAHGRVMKAVQIARGR